MTYEIYTQKELMDKVKPRHTGGYRLDLQVNNMPCARLVAFLLCPPVAVLTALLIVDVTTS